MLLQEFVEGGQVLNNELTENPLVCLDAKQGGGEVGWREEVFNESTHHPQHVLLFQEEQQTGNHLKGGEGKTLVEDVCKSVFMQNQLSVAASVCLW